LSSSGVDRLDKAQQRAHTHSKLSLTCAVTTLSSSAEHPQRAINEPQKLATDRSGNYQTNKSGCYFTLTAFTASQATQKSPLYKAWLQRNPGDSGSSRVRPPRNSTDTQTGQPPLTAADRWSHYPRPRCQFVLYNADTICSRIKATIGSYSAPCGMVSVRLASLFSNSMEGLI